MTEMEELIEIYINELSEQEKLVLDIAKDHLGSSFVIEKSIGFIEWLQKYQNE
jgi:hypothetical protein